MNGDFVFLYVWLSANLSFLKSRLCRVISYDDIQYAKLLSIVGFDCYSKAKKVFSKLLAARCNCCGQRNTEKISGYTMTSFDRQLTLINAVRYIVSAGINGCFVECGVWKGGSSMAVALALLQEGQRDRDVFLYDTFEGMTAPTDSDKTLDGTLAQQHLDRDTKKSGYWCVSGIEEVRDNMKLTGYPGERTHLIKGPVEKTIPSEMPTDPIAFLRLDTDWYESTKHELIYLFPLLAKGGVMIIDDYGHWKGSRKAVDEYFESLKEKYFLNRIDYTGRLIVKGLR